MIASVMAAWSALCLFVALRTSLPNTTPVRATMSDYSKAELDAREASIARREAALKIRQAEVSRRRVELGVPPLSDSDEASTAGFTPSLFFGPYITLDNDPETMARRTQEYQRKLSVAGVHVSTTQALEAIQGRPNSAAFAELQIHARASSRALAAMGEPFALEKFSAEESAKAQAQGPEALAELQAQRGKFWALRDTELKAELDRVVAVDKVLKLAAEAEGKPYKSSAEEFDRILSGSKSTASLVKDVVALHKESLARGVDISMASAARLVLERTDPKLRAALAGVASFSDMRDFLSDQTPSFVSFAEESSESIAARAQEYQERMGAKGRVLSTSEAVKAVMRGEQA